MTSFFYRYVIDKILCSTAVFFNNILTDNHMNVDEPTDKYPL